MKRNLPLLVLCFCAIAWLAPRHAAAEDLPSTWSLPPAESQFVFVIPDLSRFARKMALLNTELNLDIPGMADVMDEFRRTTEMNKGLNEQGSLVVAITDLSQMGGQVQPPAVLLAPVSNYADFVGNFGGNARAPQAELSMPWGQTVYARQEGEHAVLSARGDMVTNYRAGGQSTRFSMTRDPYNAKILAEADAAFMMDAAAAKPMVGDLAQTIVETLRTQLGEVYPYADIFVDRAVDSIANLVDQTNAGVFDNAEVVGAAIDIDKPGIGVTLLVQFRTGAKLASNFTTERNSDAGLARFPAEPYLFAGSVDTQGFKVDQFAPTIAAALNQQNVPWFGQKLAGMADAYRHTRRVSKVYYAPEQISLNTTLAGVNLYDTTDSRAFVAAFRGYVDSVDQLVVDLGQLPGPDGRIRDSSPLVNVRFTTQYTPNALVVEGVQVDQYQIAYNLPPQLMAALGSSTGWFVMLAGREQSGYIAGVDNQVILTATPDSTLVRKMIGTLRSGTGLGANEALVQTRDHLGEAPVAEGYFNVDSLARTLNQASRLMEAKIDPVRFEQSPLPPIGMSLQADSRGAAMRLFMPMTVMRYGRGPAMNLWYQLTADDQAGDSGADDGRGGDRMDQPGGGRIPGRGEPGGILPPGMR